MISLKDKVALVTGASGSIGSACAELIHSMGAHVVISGTNQEKLKILKDQLGSNVTIRTCDLHNFDDCQKMIEEI